MFTAEVNTNFHVNDQFDNCIFMALLEWIMPLQFAHINKKDNCGQSRGKCLFKHFSVTLNSVISTIKSLNRVILDDYDRPNRIVQINGLHVIYSVLVI